METKHGAAQDLLARLDALGFYRYAPSTQVTRLKAKFLKTPGLWNQAGARRDYPADEERLVECGIGSFLKDISPILKRAGVKIRQLEEECSGGEGYWITINGTRYEIYSKAEVVAASKYRLSTTIYENTTRRAFGLINKLLIESGSDERIYAYGGWNDHWAFILTEAIHYALCQSGIVNEANRLVLHLLCENDPTG